MKSVISTSSKIVIPYRRIKTKMDSPKLKFFYNQFVLRCENDEARLKYFYIRSKEVKALKEKLKFELNPLKPAKGLSIDTLPQNNEFVFINDKNSAIASLLYHVRNVFVHNRVYIYNTGEIELIDVIPPRHMKKSELIKLQTMGKKKPEGRITMYAKISTFSKLKMILQGLIDTQQ